MRRVNLGRKSYSRRRSGHWSAISSPRRYGFSEGLFEIPLLYGHRTLYTLRNEDGSHVIPRGLACTIAEIYETLRLICPVLSLVQATFD